MKVLLVDDSKEITEVISFFLESQYNDVSCIVINEGRKAFQEIKEHDDYDVIILDMALPEMSGYDILEQLSKENLMRSKDIVIFTASSIPEKDKQEYLKSGVKGFLQKPLSIDELASMIETFRR
jgi:two-component system aerobic respiration control sensor histidine kinase ArcB